MICMEALQHQDPRLRAQKTLFPPRRRPQQKSRLWTLCPTFSWPTLLRMTAVARAKFRPLAARIHAPWPLEHARWGKSAASARLSPTFRRRPRCRFRRPWRYSCRLVMARQIVSRRRGVVNEGFPPRCRPANRVSMLGRYRLVPRSDTTTGTARSPAATLRAIFTREKSHVHLETFHSGNYGAFSGLSRWIHWHHRQNESMPFARSGCGWGSWGGWVPAREMERSLKRGNG